MRVNEIDLLWKVPLLLLGILKAIATASLRSVGLGLLAEVGMAEKKVQNTVKTHQKTRELIFKTETNIQKQSKTLKKQINLHMLQVIK